MSVSMCERIYICLCVGVFVCVCSRVYTHLHVFLFKWPLVVSHGYLLVISLQQKVGAHSSSFSLSTVVYISFPCLHVAFDCQGEERDLLCEPCVTTDTDERG